MILVIGYGNTLRSDDGAGVRLVERLTQVVPASRVRTETGHQLTPEMALSIADPDVDGVVFVDAGIDVSEIAIRPLDEEQPSPSVGHHLTPEALMVYASRLYGRRPRAWLLTLPAYDLTHGDTRTQQAERDVHSGVDRVLALPPFSVPSVKAPSLHRT